MAGPLQCQEKMNKSGWCISLPKLFNPHLLFFRLSSRISTFAPSIVRLLNEQSFLTSLWYRLPVRHSDRYLPQQVHDLVRCVLPASCHRTLLLFPFLSLLNCYKSVGHSYTCWVPCTSKRSSTEHIDRAVLNGLPKSWVWSTADRCAAPRRGTGEET